MRAKERIPIIWKFFRNNPKVFSEFLELEYKESEGQHLHIDILKYWLVNPDQRLGQVLIDLNFILDDFDIWTRDETSWLIDKGYFKFEELSFWGVRYDTNNKPLKQPYSKLLIELTTDHIKNILNFVDNTRIPYKYLEYFNKRINENIHT